MRLWVTLTSGAFALFGCWSLDNEFPSSMAEARWRDVGWNCLRSTSEYQGFECQSFEQCIESSEPTFQLCAAGCQTVQDCIPGKFDWAAVPDFSAKRACKPLQGQLRCVLACDRSSECPGNVRCSQTSNCTGAECIDGICVFTDQ